MNQEMAGLAFLQESATRSSQLTGGMVTILTSFEERLAKLEKTILPVYNETKYLQQKQESMAGILYLLTHADSLSSADIDKTLAALDHVISYYSVSKEVEPIIKDGPTNKGHDTFIQALTRLQEAMKFFEKNNPQSVELENVVRSTILFVELLKFTLLCFQMSLFDTGKENLIHEFKELVAKHSKIIPASTIIDEISGDDDEPPNFQQFPANILQNLANIAEWLIAHNEDDYMNVIRLNDTRRDI